MRGDKNIWHIEHGLNTVLGISFFRGARRIVPAPDRSRVF